VDITAYENVARAKQATSTRKRDESAAGINGEHAEAAGTIRKRRRRPTLQPRRMSALETPPPKKLPRSAARNGTQKPSAVSSRRKPRPTR
jgi:hypothetical protein